MSTDTMVLSRVQGWSELIGGSKRRADITTSARNLPANQNIRDLMAKAEEVALFEQENDPVLAIRIGDKWHELFRWE